MDDLRFSDLLTRHALHIVSVLSSDESKGKQKRRYLILKAIIAEAMFPRAYPVIQQSPAQPASAPRLPNIVSPMRKR